jgi:diaminohydroxyphosphoribosylaminopyrimidine deaminase / 5-amino-6-(5-phosphoribosylamino)uracil reductase
MAPRTGIRQLNIRWLMNNLDYMREAFRLALKGQGKTSPNPMVGAVVVKNNCILAWGYHQRCGGPHAEIIALRKAGIKAHGAKLYVTLEPCGHFGRTPPCVDRIVAAGIKEVVVGMKDPNPLMNGKSIGRLRKAGIKVKIGFLEKELREMNAPFIKYITKKRPFIVAKIAQTLDGKTATISGQSKWITRSSTRRFSRAQRKQFDAILVGINTVLNDNPRLSAPGKPHFKKIILDSQLKIALQARLFQQTRPEDCLLMTTSKASRKKQESFRRQGYEVIVCPQQKGRVNIPWIMRELTKREIRSILVEGGAKVIGGFLKAKAVDRLHLFIAPKIFGDQQALSSIDGLGIRKTNQAIGLKILKIQNYHGDLFVEADVTYHR